MQTFRPPYRIVRVQELLQARPELAQCKITMEELPPDREEGYFPVLQFDTARVFVRHGNHSINVLGRIDNGNFAYHANAYYEDNSPWGEGQWARIDALDALVDWVVMRFKEVLPKS